MLTEIVVFDGFDEIEVFGPFETLASAGMEVNLVAVERPGPVVSMRGVRLDVETVLDQPEVVVVPGGGCLNHAPGGLMGPGSARHGAGPPRRPRLDDEDRGLGVHRVAAAGHSRPAEGWACYHQSQRVRGVARLRLRCFDERVVTTGRLSPQVG